MDELKVTEQLLDLAEGRLGADEATRVRRVAAEQGRNDDLEWIESFVRRSSVVVVGDPPADLRSRLVEEYAMWAAERRAPTLRDRIVGTLSSFGAPAGGPALAGLRGVAAPAGRQLVLAGGSLEIVFQAEGGDGGTRVDGQVLAVGDDAIVEGVVELRVAGTVVASAPVDDVGDFSLAVATATGPCELVHVSSACELTSGPLDLGPPTSGAG